MPKDAQGKSGCFGRGSPLYGELHSNYRTLIGIVLMPRPLAAVSCCGPDQLPQPSGLPYRTIYCDLEVYYIAADDLLSSL